MLFLKKNVDLDLTVPKCKWKQLLIGAVAKWVVRREEISLTLLIPKCK